MDEKLHILFLTHWLPSRNLPKNGNFILRHAEAVATKNKVTILFVEKDPNVKIGFEIIEKNTNNLNVIYVYYKESSLGIINYWRKFRAYKKGLKIVEKFDLIHLNIIHYYALIALYYKVIKNINFVVTEHWTNWLRSDRPFSFRFYCKVMSIISSYASYILPVSSDLGNKMKENSIRGEFKVIPNVVDTKIFVNEKQVKNKLTFLHISSLKDEHKNYSGILKTVQRLVNENYDFHLRIGGDGDIQPIQEFIHENNLSDYISTFGALSEKEVAEKMQKTDVFVLFSNKENQPCVINESFACGLPVIATKVGGVSEFFPKDFGILTEKGNELELYQAMKAVLENKVRFAHPEEMHQYAVNYFSMEHIAQELDEIYREVVKS